MRWFRRKPRSNPAPPAIDPEQINDALTGLTQAPSWDDTRSYLEQHESILLSSAALARLDAIIATCNAQDAIGRATELGYYRTLLADAARQGIAGAWEKFQAQETAFQATRSARSAELTGWLNTRSIRESRSYLEAHLELFDAPTDTLFDQLQAQYVANPQAGGMLQQRREMLRTMRQRGSDIAAIRATYINTMGGMVLDVPDWLAQVENAADALESQSTMQTAAQRADLWRGAAQRARAELLDALVIGAILVNQYEALYYVPDHAAALEVGIQLLTEAATIFTNDRYPTQWAIIQTNLGIAYTERSGGDPASNQAQARACYIASLQVLTPESAPEQWAQTQNSLGDLYRTGSDGDHAANLEAALSAYSAALQVLTAQDYPQLWSNTQSNIGTLLIDRVQGDHSANVEAAIEHFTQALQVATQATFPAVWAMLQNNLGIAYKNRLQGDPSANIEQAIECYHAALEVRTREALPNDWAQTQNNLGRALRERIRGDRQDNLEQAILAYQLASEVRTRDAAPLDWALTQYNLGSCLIDRIAGDHAANVEQAIAIFTVALTVAQQDNAPERWADLQEALGSAYTERVLGLPDENLQQAISCFTQALSVYTQENYPRSWAGVHNHLGLVFTALQSGDIAAHRDQALAEYALAIQVTSQGADPENWGSIQNNIGNAYLVRIRGDRSENLERALLSYQAALEVRTRERLPYDWATTQLNLGAAYTERIAGDRAANIEQSIAASQAALTVYTRDRMPADWVTGTYNLAKAYLDRVVGSQTENIETAIALLQAVLTIATQTAMPEAWARTQLLLGNCYLHRVQGSKSANIEAAIACNTAALAVYSREHLPESWALAQNNRGNAYLDRVQGNRADNIEIAMLAYQQALEIRTREAIPLDWAATQNNLGNAYGDRIKGDRSENLERAIACYTQSLQVYTRDALPELWAQTQHNLGSTYIDRTQGVALENMEAAIACYTAALSVYTPANNLQGWVRELDALALAYQSRIQGDRNQNIEQARDYAMQALDVVTADSDPQLWARIQIDLGRVSQHRIVGDRNANLAAALDYYSAAASIFTRPDYPQDWSRIQFRIGNVLIEQYFAAEQDRQEALLDQAIALFEQVLDVRTMEADPSGYRETMEMLAEAQAHRHNWDAAATAYSAALAAENQLLALTTGVRSQDAILQHGRESSTRAAFVLARLGRLEDALLTVERGRARGLALSLAVAYADPASIDDPALRGRYQSARDQLLAAQAELNRPWPTDMSADERRQTDLTRIDAVHAAQADFNATTAAIQSLYDQTGTERKFLPDAIAIGDIWQTLGKASAAVSLVYLLATPWGGLALAAIAAEPGSTAAGRVVALDLPRLTGEYVDDLLQARLPDRSDRIIGGFGHAQEGTGIGFISYTWPGDTFAAKAAALHQACLDLHTASTLDAAAQEMLAYPAVAAIAARPFGTEEYAQLAPTLAHLYLQHELLRCLPQLGVDVFTPLAAWLKQQHVGALSLIPTGGLAALPLLAAPLGDEGTPQSWHTFADEFVASLTPSARALHLLPTGTRAGVYAVGDPHPTHQVLRWGEAEARTIGMLAGQPEHVTVHEQATRAWVLDALQQAQIIDISCHGEFNAADFLGSRLLLANGETLTLGDMLGGVAAMQGLRLLVLSACQTAIVDLRGARDEVRSLAAGMLQAGAQAVLGALWSVDDKATYLLMVRFMQEWLPQFQRELPAAAIARAQRWLRTATNRELRSWQADQPVTLVAEPASELVTVRGGGLRFGVAEARERIVATAALGGDDAQPYADPIYWSAFTLTGW